MYRASVQKYEEDDKQAIIQNHWNLSCQGHYHTSDNMPLCLQNATTVSFSVGEYCLRLLVLYVLL